MEPRRWQSAAGFPFLRSIEARAPDFSSVFLSPRKPSWGFRVYPKALRTHIFRLLGLKTILYKAFVPF